MKPPKRYELRTGDCVQELRKLQAESVQVVVTSPPYWKLKDFGVDGQYGQENTIAEYVDQVSRFSQEIWRVLKPDGTYWLNLADSHKDGNLLQIPHLTSQRLQADGWVLKSEIIWSKKDAGFYNGQHRLGKMHEFIFLLAKTKDCYLDLDAVRIPYITKKTKFDRFSNGKVVERHPDGKKLKDVWDISCGKNIQGHPATFHPEIPRNCIMLGSRENDLVVDPFSGSGTTALEALDVNRRFIGIELNDKYQNIAHKRIRQLLSGSKSVITKQAHHAINGETMYGINKATLPNSATRITRYDVLGSYVDAFIAGIHSSLFIVGRTGTGKTHFFVDRAAQHPDLIHIFNGYAMPKTVHMEVYLKFRNMLLVFDDAESFWNRKNARIQMRSLADKKLHKLMSWNSLNKEMTKAGVPSEYTTSSRIAVVANEFGVADAKEFAAIVDRGTFIYFDPTPQELHLATGKFFWDQEVYDYIGDRLHLIDGLSMRTYENCYEHKAAENKCRSKNIEYLGVCWKDYLQDRYLSNSSTLIFHEVENDSKLKSVASKINEFIRRKAGSRATYYRIKQRLLSVQGLDWSPVKLPKLTLTHSPPEPLDVEQQIAQARAELAAEVAERERERKEEDEPQDHDDAPILSLRKT